MLERGLGKLILSDAFANGMPEGGQAPAAPDAWQDVLSALEEAHKDFADFVQGLTDEQLDEDVTFMVGPKQLGKMTRKTALWFLLHDQIHHRGQFSIYLRMAGGKVPSIYGPSGDEPWV